MNDKINLYDDYATRKPKTTLSTFKKEPCSGFNVAYGTGIMKTMVGQGNWGDIKLKDKCDVCGRNYGSHRMKDKACPITVVKWPKHDAKNKTVFKKEN